MPVRSENLIAWGDCDAAGIVYYPRYFHYMDIAFRALLRKAGLSQQMLTERFGANVPIIDAGAKFIAPTTFDDRLIVEAEVVHWGTTSFRVHYRGTRDGEPVFEGYEARVWAKIDAQGTISKQPIAPEFKTAVSAACRS
jgi:YbgC/YbaW family acyl-CoA thioester hydrolase